MNYLVYGSKDFALILKDMLDYHRLPFAGYIDDFATGEGIVGTFDEVRALCPPECHSIVLGVGYNNLAARWQVFERIKAAGYRVATLIHDRAYVRNPDNVGEGSVIMANATLDCNAVIEEAVVLWPGVVINHDSRIGRNTFLSPSATICGSVSVGEHCFVGAGAVVVDHVVVLPGSFIKANSLFKG
jgi:sugar O-acyltransferase (sialic acid O-acetyltransferase NeuD family)